MDYVTFGSKKEAEYFNLKAPPRTWIGATDRKNEGDFLYLDGRAADNLPWNKGEPNNWLVNEECVGTRQSHTNGYSDYQCVFNLWVGCQVLEDTENKPPTEVNFHVNFKETGKWGKKHFVRIKTCLLIFTNSQKLKIKSKLSISAV